MKRILFVDDDQAILDGFRNLLRRKRNEWQMVFTTGATGAHDALEHDPYDVVITDMRMPVTDGAALLGWVKERFPSTVRIVLSGHAEQEAVLRSLGVAHQYLSKPCTSETLLSVIERSCGLATGLQNDPLRDLIGRLDTLPAVPATYLELTDAVCRPSTNAAVLTKIVEKDPAMCAKVLQLVNSAYFGLGRPMGSVGQAVAYLGTEVLKGLALCAHVFKSGANGHSKLLSLEQVQDSSTMVARLAKAILKGTPTADIAFTAGLIHDVGQIALAAGLKDYDDVLLTAANSGRPVHEVELEMLGATHGQVGGYLLGLWGLPTNIVDAVAFHHAPNQVQHQGLDLSVAIYIAAALISQGALDTSLLTSLGLLQHLPAWKQHAQLRP